MKSFAELFPNEAACDAYLIQIRWPNGIHCPRCGSIRVYPLRGFKHKWECPDCRVGGAYRFSHLVGTIFENTKVDLRDWFEVAHILKISENKLGAREIQKIMGFGSYGTAWQICHRIRAAMQQPSWLQKLFDLLDSITSPEREIIVFLARPPRHESNKPRGRSMCLGEMPDKYTRFDSLFELIKTRLHERLQPHLQPSIRLISYMAWPNDADARVGWLRENDTAVLENITGLSDQHWARRAEEPVFTKRLLPIQKHWVAVGKSFRMLQALHQGGHQPRRGGASLGKAFEISAHTAGATGTKVRTLRKRWRQYQDVVHLATATTLLTLYVIDLVREERWKIPKALKSPIQLILLFPDIILAQAQYFERFGLQEELPWRKRPPLNPLTTWRIPQLTLPPFHVPQRALTKAELAILRNCTARPGPRREK